MAGIAGIEAVGCGCDEARTVCHCFAGLELFLNPRGKDVAQRQENEGSGADKQVKMNAGQANTTHFVGIVGLCLCFFRCLFDIDLDFLRGLAN